jgi:hypothetical protein
MWAQMGQKYALSYPMAGREKRGGRGYPFCLSRGGAGYHFLTMSLAMFGLHGIVKKASLGNGVICFDAVVLCC